jgi:hypothetical protein
MPEATMESRQANGIIRVTTKGLTTRSQVDKSLAFICNMPIDAYTELVKKGVQHDPHYLGAVIAILSSSTHGCHGAGHLTSQHLISVCAMIGLLPAELLVVAEISPSTATFGRVKEKYELFLSEETKNFAEESHTLLSAISFALKVTNQTSENTVCKVKKTAGRYVEHYFQRYVDHLPPANNHYFANCR